MKTGFFGMLGIVLGLGLASVAAAKSQQFGTVTVCYYSPECAFAQSPTPVAGVTGSLRVVSHHDAGEHRAVRAAAPAGTDVAPVDAPAFEFTNTGSTTIESAVFAIEADKTEDVKRDTFTIGDIAPGASFVIVPGPSNDGKKHAIGAFFAHSSSNTALDTSDSGPNSSDLVFEFTGKVGTVHITSGKITVGASVAPSTDGTVAAINFLGGPGNADGPCNDCVAPKVIANIVGP